MELASLMGSLGLPVSFSTRKEVSLTTVCTSPCLLICCLSPYTLQKKNTPVKGKNQGRQPPYEAANTEVNVRTCANTEELEHVQELMACVEHTDSHISSQIAADYTETCHDDVQKMLVEDSVHVEKSDCDKSQCEPNDNMSNLVNSGSSVRENQAADSVMQLNKVMLGQNFVDNESIMSCAELCHEGESSAREDQISGETPPTSHDNNDLDCEACPCPTEQSPVDNHVEKSCCDFYYEYGDWKVLWDQFYSRYYFYNIQTQESTWYLPHGLEDFASCCSTYSSEGIDEPVSQLTNTLVEEHKKINTTLDKSRGVLSCVDNAMDSYISEADQHVVQYGANMNPCDNGKTTFGKLCIPFYELHKNLLLQ